MKRLIGFVVISVWFAYTTLFGIALAVAATPMQDARSVVAMLMSADPEVRGGCSAVIISPNVALTAKHCMQITQPVVQRQGGEARVVVSFSTDPVKDLATLVVPGIGCPCAESTNARAEVDEIAYAVGFPYGIANVLSVGHIQGRVLAPDGNEYLLATPMVAPGNSGGGLFVLRGDKVYLVGILVMMVETGSPLLAVEVTL